MSNKKRRFGYSARRQKSFDYCSDDEVDVEDGNQHFSLKSMDEKDSTDNLERSPTRLDRSVDKNCRVKPNQNDSIKIAAIYNDEAEIIKILKSLSSTEKVQEVLRKHDKRGQPCIFYALESRSQKALQRLLYHVKNTECVIAANGESVLHVATKMGDIDFLRLLLKHDFVTELVNHVERENGRAPLHLAAKFNHIEIAKELLQHGAKLDRKDGAGKSPIYMAASGGNSDMLKVFLEHEKESVEDLLFGNLQGRGNYKNIFHVALGSGDESSVQVCLEQDSQIVRRQLQSEIKHGDGDMIHTACKNGMVKALLIMVEAMGHLDTLQLNRKDRAGFTPIHRAAINNHANVVKYIGAMSEQIRNETSKNSQTALVLAAQRGHIKVVEELLELKADFTISDDSDRTVLHYAIAHPKILELLLKKNDLTRFLINAKEKDGYTPVHNAALKGSRESVRILLEYGADLNVFTNTSRSPLHCAVSSQNSDVVKLVLANEHALINKPDATGKTPLHTAASYGSAKVVRCLLDHGALADSDENMFSALHIASVKGHLSIVEMLVEFDKDIIDCVNKYGRTALLTASSTSKTDVVKFLLDNNAAITADYELFNCLDWSIVNNDEKSAMMMMCHDRWKEIMTSAKHGTEGTMAKLVSNMPEVAHRALCNSMISEGHPDTKEYVVKYNFVCLQNEEPGSEKRDQLKPLTAIKAMLRTQCYSCLCHPVCCKYLKAKWMEFGWKIYSASLLVYVIFLISLNVYAFCIPSYQESIENKGNDEPSIHVKLAMYICIIFACVNSLKEIIQLILKKLNYYMDKVNYLECILYVSTFIFAVPKDGKIAIKDSAQWKACSIALFCAWLNLAMYFRRFASYGIIVLMMRRISATLIKVMVLLICFLVAFAAAFTVIMNDKEGYKSFGVSMLTSATMTMGEFDFKETFLKEEFAQYSTFYWLRIWHLIGFLIVMPIVLMNLLLALAIGDTRSIMQRAKLQKHIQTAEMIIDLERKRSRLCCKRTGIVKELKEHPNKKHDFSRTIWEFVSYGPDFSTDNSTVDSTANENLTPIVKMMKELQNKMIEIQDEFTSERKQKSRESIKSSQDKHQQFRDHSESIEGSIPEKASAENKRKVWEAPRRNNRSAGIQTPDVLDLDDIVMSAEQDAIDDKKREEKENDPELKELKWLHSKMDGEEYEDGNIGNREENVEKPTAIVDEETVPLNDQASHVTTPDDDTNATSVC